MKPMQPLKGMEPMKSFADAAEERWWPEKLGASPDSAGGQNDLRYAYFSDKKRLAVNDSGNVKIYDTGEHQISGVSQRQGENTTFTSQRGEVRLADLGDVKD